MSKTNYASHLANLFNISEEEVKTRLCKILEENNEMLNKRIDMGCGDSTMMIPKFRAWHKDNECMGEVCTIGWVNDEITRVGVIFNSSDGSYQTACEPMNVTLMQWTGLQDKNGEDIYVGDIVKMRMLGKEEYLTGGVYISPNQGAIIQVAPQDYWPLCLDNKILGNIYENPELLDNDK